MASTLGDLPATFTYAEARAAGLSKRELYRLRDEGRLQPIARGVFRRADAKPGDEGLLAIAARAPRATLCLTTALVRHRLSDAIPSAPDVALPRGTRAPVTSTAVQWHFLDLGTFEIGRSTVALDPSLEIGLYGPERSIIDAFRMRRTEGLELGREALKRWLRQRGSSPAQLLALAKHFPRVERSLRDVLEVLL